MQAQLIQVVEGFGGKIPRYHPKKSASNRFMEKRRAKGKYGYVPIRRVKRANNTMKYRPRGSLKRPLDNAIFSLILKTDKFESTKKWGFYNVDDRLDIDSTKNVLEALGFDLKDIDVAALGIDLRKRFYEDVMYVKKYCYNNPAVLKRRLMTTVYGLSLDKEINRDLFKTMQGEKLLVEKYEEYLQRQSSPSENINQNNATSYKKLASALCGGCASHIMVSQNANNEDDSINYKEKLGTIFSSAHSFHALHNRTKSLFLISTIGDKLSEYRNGKMNKWNSWYYSESIEQASVLIWIDKKLNHYTEQLANINEEKNETWKKRKIVDYYYKITKLCKQLEDMEGIDAELKQHITSLTNVAYTLYNNASNKREEIVPGQQRLSYKM